MNNKATQLSVLLHISLWELRVYAIVQRQPYNERSQKGEKGNQDIVVALFSCVSQ